MFLKLLIKAKKIPAKESMCCINQDITNILLFRINTYLLKQDGFNTPNRIFITILFIQINMAFNRYYLIRHCICMHDHNVQFYVFHLSQ